MDYIKLDNVVNDFIQNKNNSIYIDNLKEVIPLCENVINEKALPVSNYNYSINYDINDSIKIIADFLGTIDYSLQDQFKNIIILTNEDNVPLVKFNTYNGNTVTNGNAYIDLENTLDDMFVIIHELFHSMNYYELIGYDVNGNEINLGENYARKFYGESVSVVAEKMLGEYLVKNNYITENDFNIIMNKRLTFTKDDAKAVILESEFINMKANDLELNKENLEKYADKFKNDNIRNKIISEEIRNNNYIDDILNNNQLSFPIRQRYVIAQNISNLLSYSKEGIEKFKWLNNEVGNVDTDLNYVTNSIRKI